MTLVRPLAPICALLAGVGCSFVVGCGSGSGKGLIAAKNASELNQHLDRLQSAVNAGHCTSATSALRQVQTDVESLPNSVDASLRREISDGYQKLAGVYDQECAEIRQQSLEQQATTQATTEATTAETETIAPETTTTEQQPPPETTTAETTPTVPNGGFNPEPPTTTSSAPPGGATTPDQGDAG
jgi:hypothetical protein